MSAHTAAPWVVVENRYGVERKVEYLVQNAKGDDLLSLYPTDGADEPVDFPVKANAHLIAAAPDLLEALRGMAALYDGLDYALVHQRVMDKVVAARAAIAKAEGRS